MKRTFILDTLEKVNQGVKICGWVNLRRNIGNLVFIDLRDFSGIIQVIFVKKELAKEFQETIKELRPEFVLEIEGKVQKRQPNSINKEIPTGEIEILAEKIKILAKSKTPPFEIVKTEKGKESEEIRYKYRYLDLRREKNRRIILKRSKFIKFIRDFLHQENFVEIETPILGKSTPEGARDYLVPSRIYPGKFYALPQSPQQYKQLLMVAGFERYFQIAPCFRDEDSRVDRAPDQFFQLDMEMSFVSQEEILELTERIFTAAIKAVFPEKKITPSPWPRLTYEQAMSKYKTDKPDLRIDKNDQNELAFCFIIDWPYFESKLEEGHLAPAHHIFTAPKESDIPLLDTEPGKVHSWQHDLVLNGFEVGGGSLRITNPQIQEKIFELVGLEKEEAREKFGHLLEAFEYGVPPHGGIAPGLDRLLMILLNESNVREVVAFPKTSDNKDILMKAPSAVSKKQLEELHLEIGSKKK